MSPDAERSYRVDGRAWVRLPAGEGDARGREANGRTHQMVAGGATPRRGWSDFVLPLAA